MKRQLHIPVRALVEYTLRSGDLESGFFGSVNPADAIRAHQKIQKSRGPEYAGEVAISRRMETERFLLDIAGRIDGVLILPDRVVIEEIKTTNRELDAVLREENPLHWGQARCYAALYALEHDLTEIDIQLTYCRIETGDIRELRRTFGRAELEVFLREVVERYLAWAEVIAEWSGVRDESLAALEFPHPEYRAGQRAMAAAVYTAARDRGQALIQAPTGIGKTLAALFPALKAIPGGLISKIFYLTARTTGKTIAENTLETLRARGAKVKSITLTAKEKICFHPGTACSGEDCEFARGYYDRVRNALDDAFREARFTREVIEDFAMRHRVCPFEFSLDLSLWMDCIIADYNYVYNPRVYLRRFFEEKTGDYLFLVDEAHNLVDRAREMFSAELEKKPLLELRKAVKSGIPELYRILGRINAWMVEARTQCEETNPRADADPPVKLYPHLRKFLTAAERWLTLNREAPFRDALLDAYFSIHGFLRVAEQYDESYAACYEKRGDELTVKLFCIDPARQMKEAQERGSAAVFFSATLTPMDYFRRTFGCDESASELALASPFPPENLCLALACGVSTLYARRDRSKDDIARILHALIEGKKGNYLVFFPSYEYLRLIHERFVSLGPEVETIVQAPGMTEPERDAFIARFAHDNPETLAGFAVMGGVFGEGIDLVGDRLTGAAIVGVGLPALCLERELIRDYFAQWNNAGFEFAYLYPGFTKVLQAAGRVIRSETDRGVALLIDARFGSERYTSLFPGEWRVTAVRDGEQLGRVVRRFWER